MSNKSIQFLFKLTTTLGRQNIYREIEKWFVTIEKRTVTRCALGHNFQTASCKTGIDICKYEDDNCDKIDSIIGAALK